jgi:hypothetical protein
MPANTVVVSRPGPWGNPFKVGVDGSQARCVELFENLLAGYYCLSAKADLAQLYQYRKQVARHGPELRGKNLACWCKLGTPCHADVLLRLANHTETSKSKKP